MILEIISLVGGIKNVLLAIGGGIAALYFLWVKKSGDRAKAQVKAYQRKEEVEKHDQQVDSEVAEQVARVEKEDDPGSLSAEFDRLRDYADRKNSES